MINSSSKIERKRINKGHREKTFGRKKTRMAITSITKKHNMTNAISSWFYAHFNYFPSCLHLYNFIFSSIMYIVIIDYLQSVCQFVNHYHWSLSSIFVRLLCLIIIIIIDPLLLISLFLLHQVIVLVLRRHLFFSKLLLGRRLYKE